MGDLHIHFWKYVVTTYPVTQTIQFHHQSINILLDD
jgi:hypothetical protein